MKNNIYIKTNEQFIVLLKNNEEWLMDKILFYAKKYGYTKYTSTLAEAWRLSIVGLTDSLELAMKQSNEIPQMGPDENFEDDPASAFGLKEADLHRSRGVNLSMFFSLFKYYRQTYFDLLDEKKESIEDHNYFYEYINRFFDRVETAYVTHWSGSNAEKQIHELANKNRQLANEKNRYLTLFDSMHSPAIVLSKEFIIENCNQIASTVFFNQDNAGGYYYSSEKNINMDTLMDIEKLKNNETFEWNFKEKIFIVSSKILHDISGKSEGYIVLFNDISKLKSAEELLIVQSRHAAMGEMIGMLAHQWRQPITIISMEINNLLIDLEMENIDLESFKTHCYGILNETSYLSQTIEDFKSFFKPQKSKEHVTIEKILNNAKNILGKTLVYENISFDIQCDENYELYTYSTQLLQVIINILNNAKEALLEHRRDDRFIKIIIEKVQEDLLISISDNAGGIKEDILDKIFEPYFSTKNEKNGTGLGLYISDTIIKKHLLGSLSVKNINGGACFIIKIPLKKI
ncbi:MAG: sensor histidine kinase [Halarcobacter sp.]